MNKQRLDILLVTRNLTASRERAKAMIMAGHVLVDGQRIDKAGTLVPIAAIITLTGKDIPYVSRGGLKLAKALDYFKINLQDKKIADIGASTGGFTDCALKNGAAKVFAIDVGYGQLAWSLRNDSRVVCLERTNIRRVTGEKVEGQVDFITIDVSFISLTKVLPVAKDILQPAGEIVALIKPQFEAGREKVGKKGVVKDPQIHIEVINKIVTAAGELKLYPAGITYSPIKGPEGNIEYLIYLKNSFTGLLGLENEIINTVREAHTNLNGNNGG